MLCERSRKKTAARNNDVTPRVGKDQRRPVELAVVQLHEAKHSSEADDSVDALLQQKRGLGAELLLGDDGRSAEDHHQSGEDHQQGHAEQPSIHADALGH